MEEAKAMDFMSMLTSPSFEQQKEMAQITQDQAKEMADITTKNQIKVGKESPAKTTAPAAAKTATVPKVAKPAGETAGKGRPQKPISEISDEGLKTRDQGTNVGRGGKTPGR
jgi:PAB1-binding protein PBP1